MSLKGKVIGSIAALAWPLCIAPTAGAQTAAASAAAPQSAPVEAAPAAADTSRKRTAEEEIVVTGSRIRRKDLTTPAPITVINKEQVVASGKVSIGDFLQSLPEQGNAINTQVNNGGNGATRISLRGLGTARTLVLVGDPKLYDQGDVLTGDRIDLALDSKEVRVERARGRLRPEVHKGEKGAP